MSHRRWKVTHTRELLVFLFWECTAVLLLYRDIKTEHETEAIAFAVNHGTAGAAYSSNTVKIKRNSGEFESTRQKCGELSLPAPHVGLRYDSPRRRGGGFTTDTATS